MITSDLRAKPNFASVAAAVHSQVMLKLKKQSGQMNTACLNSEMIPKMKIFMPYGQRGGRSIKCKHNIW